MKRLRSLHRYKHGVREGRKFRRIFRRNDRLDEKTYNSRRRKKK
jgi:hypothetical protein